MKKIVWSAYIFFLVYLLSGEVKGGEINFASLIDLMISIGVLIGIIIYAFEISFLYREVWRLFFFVYLSWSIYRNIILEVANFKISYNIIPFNFFDIMKYIFIFIPSYFALYKLSFSKKSPLNYEKKESGS